MSGTSHWVMHFLDARGQVGAFKADVEAAVDEVLAALGPLAQSADVVVTAADRPMHPALTVVGSSYRPGRIDLVLDAGKLVRGSREFHARLRRTLFHEAHHLLRWEGPGYGRSLGEALVSEGLAQVFVHEMMDCPPEPWEVAVSAKGCEEWRELALTAFDAQDYDHEAWFFGAAVQPYALGYSLGRLMVRRALAEAPGESALSLATRPADWFRSSLERQF